jgi:hypothetical protein
MAAHLEIDSNLQPKEAPTRHAAAKAPEGLELADSIMRQFLPASRLERGRSVRESVPIRDEPPSGADRRAPDDSPQEQPVVVAPVKRAEVEPTDQPVVRPSSIRPPHWQVPPEEWSPAGKGQTILSSTLEIGRISVEILPQPAAAQPSRAQTRPAARAVRMCSGPPPSIHRFRGGL